MALLVDRVRAWALPGVLGFSVVAFAAGSSSLAGLKQFAHGGRWVVLFALLALAGGAAARVIRRSGVPPGLWVVGPPAAAFAGLAMLSTAWSPTPWLTFERAVSVWILFIAAAAVAVVANADPSVRRRLLAGLAAGAGIVAVLGFLMLAGGLDAAAQGGTRLTAWRFRGFGENPNTIPVLGAAAMPIIAWLGLTTGKNAPRIAWGLSFVALLATAVATGSRGGLAGAFVGVMLVLGLQIEWWPRKATAMAAFGLVIVLGVGLRQATQPAPPAFYSAVVDAPPISERVPKPSERVPKPYLTLVVPTGYHAALLPPRENEIGFPTLSRTGVTNLASGRVAAWIGTLRLVKDRPLLGYGFGTESRIFVDRWYVFESAVPENSTIGILLQLGGVGLAIMVVLVALLVWGGIRAAWSRDVESKSLAAVGLGTLGGALTVTVIQSYLYSVGNVASATVWVVAFVLGAGVLGKGVSRARA